MYYQPLIVTPVRRYRPPPMTARQLANHLDVLAAQDAAHPLIHLIARRLDAESAAQRILNVWRWLPTRYIADGPIDIAQSAVITFLRGGGDCEDEAGGMATLLKNLRIPAYVGVMPEHAAVFVKLRRVDNPTIQDRIDHIPWRAVEHKGQIWLALEATVPQHHRRLPGEHTDLIEPWLNTDFLHIADT